MCIEEFQHTNEIKFIQGTLDKLVHCINLTLDSKYDI